MRCSSVSSIRTGLARPTGGRSRGEPCSAQVEPPLQVVVIGSQVEQPMPGVGEEDHFVLTGLLGRRHVSGDRRGHWWENGAWVSNSEEAHMAGAPHYVSGACANCDSPNVTAEICCCSAPRDAGRRPSWFDTCAPVGAMGATNACRRPRGDSDEEGDDPRRRLPGAGAPGNAPRLVRRCSVGRAAAVRTAVGPGTSSAAPATRTPSRRSRGRQRDRHGQLEPEGVLLEMQRGRR